MVKNILALIPARGGSKGLPNKNILEICGKPLITHTIKYALNSKYIDDVIVSTDSKKIADIAIESGAEIPFMRPDYLATDKATSHDVYLYTLKELKEKYGREYKAMIVLQPTSPLRNTEDIDNAIELFKEKKADSVISVTKAEIPIAWYRKVDENLFLSELKESNDFSGRQDFEELFLPNGAIYIFDIENFLKTKKFYTDKTFAYVMEKEKSIDIDDVYDFMLAKEIMKKNMEKSNE